MPLLSIKGQGRSAAPRVSLGSPIHVRPGPNVAGLQSSNENLVQSNMVWATVFSYQTSVGGQSPKVSWKNVFYDHNTAHIGSRAQVKRIQPVNRFTQN